MTHLDGELRNFTTLSCHVLASREHPKEGVPFQVLSLAQETKVTHSSSAGQSYHRVLGNSMFPNKHRDTCEVACSHWPPPPTIEAFLPSTSKAWINRTWFQTSQSVGSTCSFSPDRRSQNQSSLLVYRHA